MYLYHDWNLYAFSWKLKRVPQVRCRSAGELSRSRRRQAGGYRQRSCRPLTSPPPPPPPLPVALLQLWRLLTNFTFLGKPSVTWLFQLIWL